VIAFTIIAGDHLAHPNPQTTVTGEQRVWFLKSLLA